MLTKEEKGGEEALDKAARGLTKNKGGGGGRERSKKRKDTVTITL